MALGLLKGFFLPLPVFDFVFDVVDPLSTSEAAAASGSSTAPRVLVEGSDASCGGKGFIEPSVSLSTAPSTFSVGAGAVLVDVSEPEFGAVLLSAAVIPTTEFPGSSAPLAKVAELAWSTAVVVADGTSTDVGSKGISCSRNASMSGFRDAPAAAGVLSEIPNRISPSNASPDSRSSALRLVGVIPFSRRAISARRSLFADIMSWPRSTMGGVADAVVYV